MATDQTQVVKYDVFLSFRGRDTRDSFTSYLFAALERRKIQTFMDTDLDRGQEIVPSLFKAIQESKVAVIVFCPNYAGSPWCLDELVEILESRDKRGMVVLPVFYHVDPSEVEEQSGEFGEGFKRLKAEYSQDKLDKWSGALKETVGIAGLDWRNHRPDHKLTEEVTNLVLNELQGLSLSGSLAIDGKLIGMERPLEMMLSLLQIGASKVLFFGIWGMGGIGKTTSAEALFYQISTDFESSYFLANVREESKKRKVICLRNEVLGNILGEEITISTPNMLPKHILNRLRRKKVLIILDDVSNEEQMVTIAGDYNWYGPGSRIVVTSRDKQVLVHRVHKIYEVKELDYHNALQLFSLHAFKQSYPEESYLQLSIMVLNYAKGVPLALKVLGSLLYKKHIEEWKSKLEKLRTMSDRQVSDVLQTSYDELDGDEKNIFLDIACFFKGEKRNWVKDILDSSGFFADIGLSRLHDKCLISIIDNKVQMHDLVQEMGWDIVLKEDYDKRSRFWKDEDIQTLMTRNMRGELTQGIFSNKWHVVDISPMAFSRMYNLRLLRLYGPITSAQPCCGLIPQKKSNCGIQCLPSSLRYIDWTFYPWKSLPCDFSPKNLIELNINICEIERLWSNAKVAPQLRRINLTDSINLIMLPDLSSVVHLEKIILRGCRKIRSLPSLIHLKSLQTLNLSGCSGLKEFPKVPSNIKELYLDETGLVEWPQSIQFLNELQLLKLNHCTNLRRLPNTLHLASLEKFNLWCCPNLKRIPDIVGKNLKVLDLTNFGIEVLPSSIGNLSSLVELVLQSTMIKELPPSIENLSSLIMLNLSETLLEGLPTSIGQLTSLVELFLNGCERLNSLPCSICELKSLKKLSMHNCLNLRELPTLYGLCSLKELDLSGCGIQEISESLGNLSTLQILDLTKSGVKKIPLSIRQLPLLEKLNLRDCKRLQYLPKLPRLARDVDASNCSSLWDVDCSTIELIEKSQYHWSPPSYRFVFSNCKHLDKSARNNITHLLRIDQDIKTTLRKLFVTSEHPRYLPFRVCLPESKIPEWFQYQSRGSNICASFSTGCYKMSSIGLALSALVKFQNTYCSLDNWIYIRCKCDLTNDNGDVIHLSFDMSTWEFRDPELSYECDHLFIWLVSDLRNYTESDELSLMEVSDVESDETYPMEASDVESGEGYLMEASFEFSASSDTEHFEVKMCGVRVVSISIEG